MWVRTKFNKEAVVTEHQIQTKPFMDS
jgi:hypothetical protein